MATLKDVAKLAGVSTSTASHVINKTRFVSDEVSARVKNAADRLNYTPSALARSLKSNSTKTLGMLIPTSTNPFFAEVIKGVERGCYEKGYNLILCNTEGSLERMQDSLEMLLQKKVDGLLIMTSDNYIKNLFGRHQPVPSLVMDWGDSSENFDQIQDNSFLGGKIATEYLISMGHKNIGCISGPINKRSACERFRGFTYAMQQANLAINRQWIVSGEYELEHGLNCFRQIFDNCQQKMANMPTALFVSNDMMAIGVIKSAYNLNINIPQDISIIGYDGIQLASYTIPPLTTIYQPKFKLGHRAVDTLIEKIQNKRTVGNIISLQPTLILGQSVKKID